MLKLDVNLEKEFEPFDIRLDLQSILGEFSKNLDRKMLVDFKKEYGLEKRYYNRIRNIQKLPNEHTFLSNEGHVSLLRLSESPEDATSQLGVRRRDRKRVRLVRGRNKMTLSTSHFKGKKGVHARKGEWFLKRQESLYDFFCEQADKISERDLGE